MIRYSILTLVVLIASLSSASESPYNLSVLKVDESVIELKFTITNSDKPVRYGTVLGRTGRIDFNIWFERDSQSRNQIDLSINNKALKQFKNYWDKDRFVLALPLKIPTSTASIGSSIHLDLKVTDKTGAVLLWSTQKDIRDELVQSEWFKGQSLEPLISQIQQNQLANSNVQSALNRIDEQQLGLPCSIQFDVAQNLLSPALGHCQSISNPVFGKDLLDSQCVSLTKQWFEYLVDRSTFQCNTGLSLSSYTWPTVSGEFNNRLYQAWYRDKRGLESADTETQHQSVDLNWIKLQLEAINATPKQLASFKKLDYYSDQISRRLRTSQNNQQYLIQQQVFKDLVLSELIKGIVTKHFKMRDTFSNWCQSKAEWHDAREICFQFSADLSVSLFQIYGFKNLFEFNQSIDTFRQAYIIWAKGTLGKEETDRSIAYIKAWATEFSETSFGQSDCSSRQLFPLGGFMANERLPDFNVIAYPGGEPYQKMVRDLARTKERFVQQLWNEITTYNYDPERNPVTCVKKTLYGDLFAPILQTVKFESN